MERDSQVILGYQDILVHLDSQVSMLKQDILVLLDIQVLPDSQVLMPKQGILDLRVSLVSRGPMVHQDHLVSLDKMELDFSQVVKFISQVGSLLLIPEEDLVKYGLLILGNLLI